MCPSSILTASGSHQIIAPLCQKHHPVQSALLTKRGNGTTNRTTTWKKSKRLTRRALLRGQFLIMATRRQSCLDRDLRSRLRPSPNRSACATRSSSPLRRQRPLRTLRFPPPSAVLLRRTGHFVLLFRVKAKPLGELFVLCGWSRAAGDQLRQGQLNTQRHPSVALAT